MATLIGALNINVTAQTDSFAKKMKSARKITQTFAVDLRGAATKLLALGTAYVGATRTVSAFNQQLDQIDALAKTSDKLGIATEKLVGLQHAAELGGVGAASLEKDLLRMERSISEAALGTGIAADELRRLGLSAEDLLRMSPDQQFTLIAEAMAGLGNQSDLVRVAMNLFGRSAADLIPVLAGGAAALADAQREAELFGGAIDREAAAKIEHANDQLTRIKAAMSGFIRQLTIRAAPFLDVVYTKILDVVDAMNGMGGVADGVFRHMVDAAGVVADGVYVIAKAFEQTRAGLTSLLPAVVDAVDLFAPFVEFDQQFRDSINASAAAARQEWANVWSEAELPSAKIKAWAAGVLDITRRTINSSGGLFGEDVGALGDALGTKLRGSVTAGALSRGSVEAFQAVNRAGEARELERLLANAEKRLELQREQVSVERETLKAVRDNAIALASVRL